jgi:hypothetical protein
MRFQRLGDINIYISTIIYLQWDIKDFITV